MIQLFFLIFFLLCSSCSDLFLTIKKNECEIDNPKYNFDADIKPIIDQYCISCHHSDYPSGNLNLSAYNEFNISIYFIPGDTTQGKILNRINDINNPMPPAWAEPMDEKSIQIINTWILECAVEN